MLFLKKMIAIILIALSASLVCETLFEVKDASNNKVLDVSTDGLRVMNLGDTLMVISSSAIKANIRESANKALSRTFSVTTTSAKGKGLINALEVGTSSTTMSAPDGEYTNFSPLNIFMGLEAGASIGPGKYNVMLGNYAGNGTVGVDDFSYYGWSNTFLGESAGRYATNSTHNVYIGKSSGAYSADGGDNTFIGTLSGQNNNGSANTFIGSSSGGNGSGTGSSNTYLGYLSGAYTTSGSSNLMLGDRAGYNIRAGSNNVSLGFRAGYSNQAGVGNVLIGYEAGFSETGSNKLYIANSSTSTPLIGGTFPNTDLTFTANTVTVNHTSGISNGLYIKNASYSNNWHFYQYSTGGLYLYYNGIQRGFWNSTTGVYTPYAKEAKNSVEDIELVTDKVMKLNPKRYNFTTQKSGDLKYIGLIAEDLNKIFPEFVFFNDEDNSYSVDYAGLSVVAIQAIKEQKLLIDQQENRIEKLEELVQKLLEK
ncbi:TPA: hypothetical protein DCR49_06085 [Candidatus Delongbacteria bacterium]|nr:MAG: hypothetical protein A2Y39_06695 [Candidatus Delongbacteria bacterium GWF2_40_14]HAQ61553.1 hypothetical protein [Candidatus Delongbacteria bacterium]